MTVPGWLPSRPESGADVPTSSSPGPASPSSSEPRHDALHGLDVQDVEVPGTAQALEQFFGDP